MKIWIRLFAVLAALTAAPALAQLNLGASSGQLLEPEKAFQFSAHAVAPDDPSSPKRNLSRYM